jgi:hypothetical protein
VDLAHTQIREIDCSDALNLRELCVRAGLTVMLDVRLGCFGGVVRGMVVMAVGQVRVMRGQFVSAGLVMVSCFLVVPGCMFVMFCCLVMMFRCLLGHSESSNGVAASVMECGPPRLAWHLSINRIQNLDDCAVDENSGSRVLPRVNCVTGPQQ